MEFLSRYKVSHKLMTLLLLSVAVLGYFAVISIEKTVREYESAKRVTTLASLTDQTQTLIRELYTEAAVSALYLENNNRETAEQLARQQTLTDRAITLWNTQAGTLLAQNATNFTQIITDTAGAFADLATIRSSIVDRQISFSRVYPYFQQVNQRLMGVTLNLKNFLNEPALSSAIHALTNFAELEAQAGNQFAVLTDVFARGHFVNQDEFAQWMQSMSAEHVYQTEFSRWATPVQNQAFATTLVGDAVKTSQQLAQLATEYPRGLIPAADPNAWYAAQRSKLILLGGIGEQLTKDLAQAATIQERGAFNTLVLQLTLLAAVIFILGIWLLRLVGQMNRSLHQVTALVMSIGKGKYDNHIDQSNQSETGKILRVLAALQSKLRQQQEKGDVNHSHFERLEQALNNTQACAMVTDNEFKVTYINKALQRLLSKHEAQFQKDIKEFTARNIVGMSLQHLFKNPTYHAKIFKRLQTVVKEQITLGDIQLELIFSPLNDKAGSCRGILVEWVDLDSLQENKKSEEARRLLAEQAECLSKVTRGDLTAQVVGTYHEPNHQYAKESLNKAVQSMNTLLHQTRKVAGYVHANATHIQEASAHIINDSHAQVDAVQKITTTLQVTDQKMRQMTGRVQQASHLMTNATDTVMHGREKIDTVVNALEHLTSSSQEIDKIIKIVEEIAFQTNLLALNASVEAARAGQHGKGFTLIAQEVRNLAARSARAAKESAQLLEESTRRVLGGVGIAKETSMTLDGMLQNLAQLKSLVADLSEGNIDHLHHIEQIHLTINRVCEEANNARQYGAQLTTEMQQLTQGVEQLNQHVARFKLAPAEQRPIIARGVSGQLLNSRELTLVAHPDVDGSVATAEDLA